MFFEIQETFEGGKERSIDFDIFLVDSETQELEIPEIDFDFQFVEKFSVLKKLFNDFCFVSDHVKLKTESHSNSMILSCKGDIGSASMQVNIDSKQSSDDVDLDFSLRFINTFLKCQITPDVNVCLKQDFPLCFVFNMPGSSYMRCFLAPRMDGGDED